MADNFYYYVNYHATCEKCGKRFDGYIERGVAKNDSEILGDMINSFADSVDGMNARKYVETRVNDGRWSELRMPYGLDGHSCPHCGARQSWDPPVKPQEPEKKQRLSSKAGAIGWMVFGSAFAGGVLGLIAYLIQSFVFYEDDPAILAVVFTVCVVAGVIIGLWSNKKTGEDLADTYDERMEAYRRNLADYEVYERDVAARPSRNKPIADLAHGFFYPRQLTTLDELAKAHPNACPSCGKKLEGQVLAHSVHAARVNAGCCPWCGEKLPAGRQVRLG